MFLWCTTLIRNVIIRLLLRLIILFLICTLTINMVLWLSCTYQYKINCKSTQKLNNAFLINMLHTQYGNNIIIYTILTKRNIKYQCNKHMKQFSILNLYIIKWKLIKLLLLCWQESVPLFLNYYYVQLKTYYILYLW